MDVSDSRQRTTAVALPVDVWERHCMPGLYPPWQPRQEVTAMPGVGVVRRCVVEAVADHPNAGDEGAVLCGNV